jgi:hypothetical protein
MYIYGATIENMWLLRGGSIINLHHGSTNKNACSGFNFQQVILDVSIRI